MSETFQIVPIGWVESSLVDPEAAPKQGSEGGPDAWLAFSPEVEPGLRDVVHPRDNLANPLTGVFSTRSADRTNPIGIHQVPVLAVEGTRVLVADMEAIDRTPIIDVKPVL